jgi:hypothetical protein
MQERLRNIIFVLAGVGGLLLKPAYHGPLQELVRSYAGNLSISFAVYFLATRLKFPAAWGRWPAALVALAAVQAFEATDGFGFMSNTFDPWDYAANTAGVALAVAADLAAGRLLVKESRAKSAS